MTMLIHEKPFLILDCQTTGMNAKDSHIIEIAWATWQINQPCPRIESYLMRLPDNVSIPKKIQQITGITTADLEQGSHPADILIALQNAIAKLDDTPTVVSHYAQFEHQFLTALFENHSQTAVLPFTMICSQKITKKLFPGIPSLTIAGIAGYLGVAAPHENRAVLYVKTTYAIWNFLIEQMCEHSITTFEELTSFLNVKINRSIKKIDYRMDKIKRLNLPTQPGIYKMISQEGKVLYVGKASSLKCRVNSYFRGIKNKNRRTQEMIAQVWDIKVTPCQTPLEAALMEVDEIKNHAPPYNVILNNADRVFLFYNKDYSDYSHQQNDIFCNGPYRPFSGVENLINFSHWLKTGNTDFLMFPDVSEQSINAGFFEFCEKINFTAERFKNFSYRQLISFAYILFRKYGKKDFEKDWAKQKKLLKTQPDYAEVIDTPHMVVAKFERIFLRAAKEVQRSKQLTKLLNAKVVLDTAATSRELAFQHGKLTAQNVVKEKSHPWQDATIADFDRMSILLAEVTKKGYLIIP